ncbi:hypothetical protein BGZ49_004577 [Haplosporangium sp. Z 27]|nr:hypothetical protein BGZ49_004577 [Haplosporangium sp. Z 27]
MGTSDAKSGSVDESVLEEALPRLREQISKFDPNDVYNMDELDSFIDSPQIKQSLKSKLEETRKTKPAYPLR